MSKPNFDRLLTTNCLVSEEKYRSTWQSVADGSDVAGEFVSGLFEQLGRFGGPNPSSDKSCAPVLEQAKSFFTSEDFTFAELNDRALLQLQHATLNTLLFVALSFPMDIADERLQQVIADWALAESEVEAGGKLFGTTRKLSSAVRHVLKLGFLDPAAIVDVAISETTKSNACSGLEPPLPKFSSLANGSELARAMLFVFLRESCKSLYAAESIVKAFNIKCENLSSNEAEVMALLHILKFCLKLNPNVVSRRTLIEETLERLSPLYLLPKPYGTAARELLVALRKECICPGFDLRKELLEVAPTAFAMSAESLFSESDFDFSSILNSESFLSSLAPNCYADRTYRTAHVLLNPWSYSGKTAQTFLTKAEALDKEVLPSNEKMDAKLLFSLLVYIAGSLLTEAEYCNKSKSFVKEIEGWKAKVASLQQERRRMICAIVLSACRRADMMEASKARPFLNRVFEQTLDVLEKEGGEGALEGWERPVSEGVHFRDLYQQVPGESEEDGEGSIVPLSSAVIPPIYLDLKVASKDTSSWELLERIGTSAYLVYEGYEELLNIFENHTSKRKLSRSSPLRIIVVGGGGTLHQFVANFVALRQLRPEYFFELDLRIFVIPTGVKNNLANFIGLYDALYARLVHIPWSTPLPMIPHIQTPTGGGSAMSLQGSIFPGVMQRGSDQSKASSTDNVPIPARLWTYLARNYVADARHCLRVRLFEVECWGIIGSSPDLQLVCTVPFYDRIEIGAGAKERVASEARVRKMTTTNEDKTSKSFSLDLTLSYTSMNLLGVESAVTKKETKSYHSIVASNIPRCNERVTLANPTVDWLEVYITDADTKSKKNKKSKAMLDGELHHNLHLSKFEIAADKREGFDVLIDDEIFGPFQHVKVSPSKAPGGTETVSLPIQHFAPLDL